MVNLSFLNKRSLVAPLLIFCVLIFTLLSCNVYQRKYRNGFTLIPKSKLSNTTSIYLQKKMEDHKNIANVNGVTKDNCTINTKIAQIDSGKISPPLTLCSTPKLLNTKNRINYSFSCNTNTEFNAITITSEPPLEPHVKNAFILFILCLFFPFGLILFLPLIIPNLILGIRNIQNQPGKFKGINLAIFTFSLLTIALLALTFLLVLFVLLLNTVVIAAQTLAILFGVGIGLFILLSFLGNLYYNHLVKKENSAKN